MADYILQVFEWPKSLGSAGINYIEESNRQESQVNTEKCIWHCIHSLDVEVTGSKQGKMLF